MATYLVHKPSMTSINKYRNQIPVISNILQTKLHTLLIAFTSLMFDKSPHKQLKDQQTLQSYPHICQHPTCPTRSFTLVNAKHFQNNTPINRIMSWLLPCTCHLPRCKCPTRYPNVLCFLGTTPTNKLPLKPNPT